LSARLSYDFPLPTKYRTKSSFRHLLAGHPNLPRSWNQEPKPGRTFLPIDQLAYLFKQTFQTFEPNGDIGVPFTLTNHQIQKTVLSHWKTTHPPPEYYHFDLTTKPHLFMSYDKFISGRLHQFRVQKSYLAAHQPYYNRGLSTTCPRCHLEEEDLHHALIECPLRRIQREEFIPELISVDDIWRSPTVLFQTILYLRATMTGFPPARTGWFPLSPSVSSDELSEVDSISSSVFTLQV